MIISNTFLGALPQKVKGQEFNVSMFLSGQVAHLGGELHPVQIRFLKDCIFKEVFALEHNPDVEFGVVKGDHHESGQVSPDMSWILPSSLGGVRKEFTLKGVSHGWTLPKLKEVMGDNDCFLIIDRDDTPTYGCVMTEATNLEDHALFLEGIIFKLATS